MMQLCRQHTQHSLHDPRLLDLFSCSSQIISILGLEKQETDSSNKVNMRSRVLRYDLWNFESRSQYRILEKRQILEFIKSAGLTIINEGINEGVDIDVFLERLADATKLMTEAHYNHTQSRRACIIPLIETKGTREFLKQTKSDSSLFGSNLESELKKFKETESVFEAKKQPAPTSTRYQGNGKRPFDRRPLSSNQGNFNTSTGGQARQKLFFKGYNQRSNNKMYQKQNIWKNQMH
ncbi:unnamed protein product [Trichogramma brassicae]|uniref:Uncharacterized protein n=1 Tax=Trichogramma brassicae TaxID=86971 RepID=A0A6H5IZH9_9HYME|nr:unnamed protein product [Trichogramma brassicae]